MEQLQELYDGDTEGQVSDWKINHGSSSTGDSQKIFNRTRNKLYICFGDALEDWNAHEKLITSLYQPDHLTDKQLLDLNDAEKLENIKQRFKKIHIVGNLPFNVSSPLLIMWLRRIYSKEGILSHPDINIGLMFQEEVGMVSKTLHFYRH